MQRFIDSGEKNTDLILEVQDYIWKNTETGYRKWKANINNTKNTRSTIKLHTKME